MKPIIQDEKDEMRDAKNVYKNRWCSGTLHMSLELFNLLLLLHSFHDMSVKTFIERIRDIAGIPLLDPPLLRFSTYLVTVLERELGKDTNCCVSTPLLWQLPSCLEVLTSSSDYVASSTSGSNNTHIQRFFLQLEFSGSSLSASKHDYNQLTLHWKSLPFPETYTTCRILHSEVTKLDYSFRNARLQDNSLLAYPWYPLKESLNTFLASECILFEYDTSSDIYLVASFGKDKKKELLRRLIDLWWIHTGWHADWQGFVGETRGSYQDKLEVSKHFFFEGQKPSPSVTSVNCFSDNLQFKVRELQHLFTALSFPTDITNLVLSFLFV